MSTKLFFSPEMYIYINLSKMLWLDNIIKPISFICVKIQNSLVKGRVLQLKTQLVMKNKQAAPNLTF